MPKTLSEQTKVPQTMSEARNLIKRIAAEFGVPVNNGYAKKLAARFLVEQRADLELRLLGLDYDPLDYSDTTGDEVVRAWFAALLDRAAVVS